MSIPFPHIDPILVQIGPLAIRWYSLAYIAGVVIGWLLVKRELKKRPLAGLPAEKMEDMVVWAIAGIIFGGRLAYVLFYKPEYYLSNPLEALQLWKGGMSFHGGCFGFAFAFYLFCRKHGIQYFKLMDLMACVAPIGIGFGRLANFINGELWGRYTTVPWAMVFPNADILPRHPSQLYEAALEGALLLIIMLALLHYTKLRERPGMLSGIFLIGYGCARIFCEFFREPDAQLGFLWEGATMGQLLSVPMLLLGAFLVMRSKRHAA